MLPALELQGFSGAELWTDQSPARLAAACEHASPSWTMADASFHTPTPPPPPDSSEKSPNQASFCCLFCFFSVLCVCLAAGEAGGWDSDREGQMATKASVHHGSGYAGNPSPPSFLPSFPLFRRLLSLLRYLSHPLASPPVTLQVLLVSPF